MIWINKWHLRYKLGKECFEIAQCFWTGKYTKAESMQEFGLVIEYYGASVKFFL